MNTTLHRGGEKDCVRSSHRAYATRHEIVKYSRRNVPTHTWRRRQGRSTYSVRRKWSCKGSDGKMRVAVRPWLSGRALPGALRELIREIKDRQRDVREDMDRRRGGGRGGRGGGGKSRTPRTSRTSERAPRRRALACRSSSATACSTARTARGLAPGRPWRTRSTVASDRPACSAMSATRWLRTQPRSGRAARSWCAIEATRRDWAIT